MASPAENSGPAAESSGGGGGLVCFEHRAGHTRKCAVRELRRLSRRVPGTGRWRRRHGTLRRVTRGCNTARSVRPASGSVSTVVDPAGFQGGRGPPGAAGLAKGGVRRPKASLPFLIFPLQGTRFL